MGKVVRFRRNDVDAAVELVQDHNLEELVLVGKDGAGDVAVFFTENTSLETLSTAIVILQDYALRALEEAES